MKSLKLIKNKGIRTQITENSNMSEKETSTILLKQNRF
jgi:hypothetical protein